MTMINDLEPYDRHTENHPELTEADLATGCLVILVGFTAGLIVVGLIVFKLMIMLAARH